LLSSRTVLRGGYGIFFGQMNGGGFNNAAAPSIGFDCATPYTGAVQPFVPYTTISHPFPDGFCKAAGSSRGVLTGLGLGIDFIDRGNRTPYSQQWSFSIQRQLPLRQVLELSYSGTRGIKLPGSLNMNQQPEEAMALKNDLIRQVSNPYYGLITTGALAARTIGQGQLLRPYPQFTGLTSRTANYGSSIYHALYVKVDKRLSNGLSYLVSYSWSKLIDDVVASNHGFPGESFAGGELQNFRNRRMERALATFDTPHNLTVSGIYELPFGKGKRRAGTSAVVDAIAGGWQLNGILTIYSGAPLQITGGNSSGLAAGAQRPNWSGRDATLHGEISERLDRYFDTSQFSANDLYTFGNAPRLMPNLRAPGPKNLDLSVFKNFPIREWYKLQLRVEFFNLPNRPQFGLPTTGFSLQQAWGVINSQVNNPRNVQLALKLSF
jgi:hypothetical protein